MANMAEPLSLRVKIQMQGGGTPKPVLNSNGPACGTGGP